MSYLGWKVVVLFFRSDFKHFLHVDVSLTITTYWTEATGLEISLCLLRTLLLCGRANANFIASTDMFSITFHFKPDAQDFLRFSLCSVLP